MFDMLPAAFGDAPEIYVEKQDGKWSKTLPGDGLGDFWYAGGEIDISNATGRILAASATRPEGVLLTFNPTRLEGVEFEYDRYKGWPNAYGHMFELIFKTPSKVTTADSSLGLKVGARIVPDARSIVTGSR